MTIPEATLEACFDALCDLAIADERCPGNQELADQLRRRGFTKTDRAVSELVRQGRVRIKVGAPNYRVVEILTGPHAGKHTLRPRIFRPHTVIAKDGPERLISRIRSGMHRRGP
jgi:hypothetical protein